MAVLWQLDCFEKQETAVQEKGPSTLLTGHAVVIVSPLYLSAPVHKMELMEHHIL